MCGLGRGRVGVPRVSSIVPGTAGLCVIRTLVAEMQGCWAASSAATVVGVLASALIFSRSHDIRVVQKYGTFREQAPSSPFSLLQNLFSLTYTIHLLISWHVV